MTHSDPQFVSRSQPSGQACFARYVPGLGLWLCTAPMSYKCPHKSAWLDDFCSHPNRRNSPRPTLDGPASPTAS